MPQAVDAGGYEPNISFQTAEIAGQSNTATIYPPRDAPQDPVQGPDYNHLAALDLLFIEFPARFPTRKRLTRRATQAAKAY